MAKTVLLRIDDRLMHGQIGKSWLKEVGADIIVVVNDRTFMDENSQKLMEIVTPLNTKIYFLTVEKAIKELDDLEDDAEALVLVENPKDALSLIENGLDIDMVNVGNMSRKYYKKKVNETVYVDDDDISCFKELKDLGKTLDIRALSTDDSDNDDKIFN